jgi:hypothetical protein
MSTFKAALFGGKPGVLRVSIEEHDGSSFTITAATCTIISAAGTKLRDAVSASIDNSSTPKRAYYQETFNAANGYTEGETCTVVFVLTTSDGYIEPYQGTINILSRADI